MRAGDGATVQLWDCSEFGEPTCVQTKPAEPPPVQARCAACEQPQEQPQEQHGQAGKQAPVQRDGDAGVPPEAIQREAGKGLSSATAPLPHAERIQAAFGHHDLSDVRAAVGGPAATASRRMGALAFASGNRIGFRESPGLHLAAHEAAHVVQQRSGLRLPGNVGRPGDPWERHADDVADAVVRGRSAQPLLDKVARPGKAAEGHGGLGANARTGPVQHRLTTPPTRSMEPPAAPPQVPGERAGSKEGKGAGAKGGAAPAGGETGSALEAAGGDTEAPPEGVTTGATGSPGAGGGAAGAPPGAAARPAAPASGGALNAPCYNVDPPPRPSKTKKPKSDNDKNEAKGEERVTFDAWQDLPDVCPAEAAMAQAGGPAAGAPAAGAPPPAEAAGAAGPEGAKGTAGASGKAKGGGGGGGAGAGEGAPAAEGAPAGGLDSEIGQAEGQRDTAIGDYEQAAAALETVQAGTGQLRSGLVFAGGGPQTEGARDKAIGRTGAFLDAAAGQIASAAAFGLQRLPGRLGSLADSINANTAAAIDLEKAAISERIMGARARSMGAAQAARAHVLAEHAASVATVEAETDAALATLDDEYGTALEQTDEKETGGLADVNGRFAAGRRSHEQKGPQYAGRAVRRGQEHVRQYERCKTHPKTGVAYDDDGFWDGCLTVRRARAQQDVACKTAGSYRNAFLRTANKKGYDLIELRKVYRCAVIAGARQVNQTLDDLYDRLTSGLESARTQAIKGLGMARDQNMAAIDAALAGSLGGLAAQEAAQRQAAADTGYLKQLAVEQLAHSGAANLVRGVSAASASLQQVLGTVRDRLAAGGVPDPDWLTLTLGTLQSALGGGMETLLGKMEEGAQGAERTLVELGMASLAALQKVTEGNDALAAQAEAGFTAQMQGLMAGATSAFGQLTGSLVEQAQDGAAQGTEAMQAAVTGFATALGTIGGKVTAAVAASLAELVKDLDGKIAELDEQIASEAWKAASKEQPAWKKVVAIVLIILVIIAAAVISIVTLGAGASLFAVILVGALVGAASAGLIQILNNWSSGEAWDEGLVTAMVMGAIGGAIGGGLGFAGGALAAGAGAAGARVATQLAIQVGADLAAEGITQTVGYFAFGQEFNWQGFLMAGTMSSVGFRATPAKPHVPVPHPPAPRAGGAPHGPAAPHAGGPHPAAPDAPRPHAPEPAPPRPGEAPATRPGDAPPARPGEAAPARPADAAAPGPGTAGAAAGRRAAVAQVAGGAVLGFAVEGIGAWLSGQKFDMTRAASAAAGGAVSARAARMGHGSAPREAPDTRLGRAGDRLRQFDPGDAGARLGKRLEDAGGRLFGRPEVDAPSGGMAPARPRTDEALPSGAKVDEPAPAPRPADTGEGPAAPPRRPDTADDPAAPRAADAGEGPARPPRGTGEAVPEGPPTRDRSAAELAETTHAPVRVGNEDHDVYFTRRNGHVECDICSFGCGSIKSNLRHMQAALPDTPDGVRLRDQLQEIHTRVVEVEAGIEGATIPHRDVIAASAGIADSLHALGMAEPRLGAAIDNPNVFQRVYDPADVDTAGRPRVRTDDLGGETAPRTSAPIGKVPELKLPNGTPLPEGTPLLYVLRDKETGAVLKVGETAVGTAAEARFERYRFAAEELDVRAVIEITPVTDLRGRKITDYESDLRARMEAAGHIMPWDYTRVEGSGGMGRLGRAGPGTPFESLPGSATSKLRRDKWDWERGDTPRKGYLLPPGEGSGTAPVRGKIQLDELVGMLREGRTTKQIADHFGVPEPSVRRAKSNWRRILAERLK
nr:DUF4157 domain-containing protein [Pseudoduganella umbonata]